MSQCGIYCIHNTANGKRYVGQSVNIRSRLNHHFWFLRNGTHYNEHLQASFHQYGESVFEHYVLEEASVVMLDERERAWIEHYKSNERQFGFNNDSGGCSRKSISETTRLKMSRSMMGHHVSFETRMKLRAAATGKKHSAETRAKISMIQKGRPGFSPSQETRNKQRLAKLGRKLSQEHKAKIGASLRRGSSNA